LQLSSQAANRAVDGSLMAIVCEMLGSMLPIMLSLPSIPWID
jgi:hypothetical protein